MLQRRDVYFRKFKNIVQGSEASESMTHDIGNDKGNHKGNASHCMGIQSQIKRARPSRQAIQIPSSTAVSNQSI
jgi:hypothetical protein